MMIESKTLMRTSLLSFKVTLLFFTANSYYKIVNRSKSVAKEVANETMRDASQNLPSKSKDLNDDTVIDTIVLCYGSWRIIRR